MKEQTRFPLLFLKTLFSFCEKCQNHSMLVIFANRKILIYSYNQNGLEEWERQINTENSG